MRILTPNFLDEYTALTVTGGGDATKLFDTDIESPYESENFNRDDAEVVLQAEFRDKNGTIVERSFNAFIIIRSNLRDWIFERFDDDTEEWVQIVAVAEQKPDTPGTDFHCFTFGTHKATKVRLRASKTWKPNQEKQVGELIVARQRFAILDNPISYRIRHTEIKRVVRLGNGKTIAAYNRFAPNRTQRYGATIQFEKMDEATLQLLKCLKNEGQPFLWYPEAHTRPEEIYLVDWSNPLSYGYSEESKYLGNDLTMELDEV